MKKWFGLLIFAVAALAGAQTTSVSATVVDTDGTTWANGSWKVQFVPNPSQPTISKYNINGAPLSPSVVNQSGSLNTSGVLALSVYQNGAITPVGSQWQLTVCPDAISACGSLNFTASGSSQDISTLVNASITAPRFQAVSGSYGYADVEAIFQLKPGSTYYNVTSAATRCYDGSNWAFCSAGGASVLSATAFGITCDGTDKAAQFQLLHTYLLAHDGSIVSFQPGAQPCVTSDPTWLFGVKNAHLLFNGAQLKLIAGTSCYSVGGNPALATNLDYFRGPQFDSPTCSLHYASNYKIHTVNVGDTSLTLVTHGDAANFPVGTHIWLNGYDQQSAGYPPNLRYFEIRTVTSMNSSTGVLGLDVPAENYYDENWLQGNYNDVGLFGAASIMSLSRTTQNVAFTLEEHIVIEDLALLANPGSPDALTYNGFGSLYPVGIKNFECLRCTLGAFIPQDGGTASVNNSTVYYFEPDKNQDYAIADGGTIHGVTDGAGTNNVTVQNVNITPYTGITELAAWSANKVLKMTHNRVYGGCLGGDGPTVIATENDCIVQAGDTAQMFFGDEFGSFPFTVITAPTLLSVTTALNLDFQIRIRAGTLVATAATGGKSCWVSRDPVSNGTNLTLTFSSCSSNPAPGDVFSIYTTQNLISYGNSCGFTGPCNPVQGLHRVARWNQNILGTFPNTEIPFGDAYGNPQYSALLFFNPLTNELWGPTIKASGSFSVDGFSNLGLGANLSSASGQWKRYGDGCSTGDFSQNRSAASAGAILNICSPDNTWVPLSSLYAPHP